MKQGIKSGIGFIVVGGIFIAVNMVMMNGKHYYPALLVMSPAMILLGIGFIAFKGGEPGPEVPVKEKGKYHMRHAPVLSKVMWGILALIGLAIGFYWMMQVDGGRF